MKGETPDENLGARVKTRRLQVGLSLRELSKRTGLTPSFLSQVERGQTNSSISSLRKIADALETPLQFFFSNGRQYSPVVRAGERAQLTFPGTPVTYEVLTPDMKNRKNDVLLGRSRETGKPVVRPTSLPAEEFLLVVSGCLTVELDTGEYTLNTGDSIVFQGATFKQLVPLTPNGEETVWLSVRTPPVL